ncbi:MAG: hypothetical protein KIS92_12485 [Planctomycetota bacterium]|nr:hypothetical protein [Planctomycetota bacterium]
MPQTAAQLYAVDRALTNPLVGDPSVTMLENDRAYCGVLLAASCWQQAWSPILHLEGVTWIRFERCAYAYTVLSQVALMAWDGAFGAMDSRAGRFLPNMSARPFATKFVPLADYELQGAHLQEGLGGAVFRFVQSHFADVPGFSTRENALTSPEDYARIVPPADLAALAA